MAFSQFKTVFKKAVRQSGKRNCVCYRDGETFWIGTGDVMVNCSHLSQEEQTILRHEVTQITVTAREDVDLPQFINRWVNDRMKPVTRTKVRWESIVVLTSEHGTCGVEDLYLEVFERLLDTDQFSIDWGGTKALRVTTGERLVGFIGPVVFPDPEPVRSALESILAGLPVPTEVSG